MVLIYCLKRHIIVNEGSTLFLIRWITFHEFWICRQVETRPLNFFKSGRIVIIVLVAVAAATTYALDGEWVPKALSYD